MQSIIARAAADKQRIVFPEGTEERTLTAADRLLGDDVVRVILIGDPDAIRQAADAKGLKHIRKAELMNPLDYPKMQDYAELLYELRKAKGMTTEKALALAQNPLYIGCLMITLTEKLPARKTLRAMCCVRLCKSYGRNRALAACPGLI